MATKAQPVRVGPFSGGMNTYSDPSAIADEDAVEIINFDVDLDGSLTSRPPIVAQADTAGRYNSRFLGTYTTSAGTNFIIFACQDGSGNPLTCFYNINAATFGNITAAYSASAMVQYQNKAWLIAPPGASTTGGSWDGSTYSNVASMPKGETATVYKERIFIGTGAKDATNPSRVFFSGPANPSSWTGTDFFDVNNGDGQPIVAIYSSAGSIVIFKSKTTYVFAYESSPTKGQVQSVSSSVGLENADCITESENVLYVLYNNNLYSISNWNWEILNVKVPFEYRNSRGANTWRNFSVSSMGKRIVVRYYDNYYIYGTKTRAWTVWQTNRAPHQFLASPIIDTVTGVTTLFADNFLISAAGTESRYFYRIKDTLTSTDTESFNTSLKTKVYDFNVPYSYKRLMWWGADLLARAKVTAVVSPITYATPVYIKTIKNRPIGDFLTRPIGRLLDPDIDVTDSADVKNPTGVRMFIKYLKSLRFRQVQFSLSSTLDGSTNTGPLKIYSLTAYVANKETVRDKIN